MRPLRTLCLALLGLGLAATLSAQQAPCVDGLAHLGGTNYECHRVDLHARVSLATMNAASGNDVWGWTDPATDREFALMGLDNGTFFADVTDPDAPLLLGKLPTTTQPSLWRDMKVFADHAFVVSEAPGHGMQVFDLTRLRGLAPDPARLFTSDAVFHGEGEHTLGRAHNVAINEDTGYAYVVGARILDGTARVCAGGLYMVDIRDPQSPRFAGCFADDGYTHDVQCVIYHGPDTRYTDREICFASNEDSVTIVDVTDKARPVGVARVTYPYTGYTHQGWLTEDHSMFFVNDELDEIRFDLNTRTLVFDVSNLEAAAFAGSFFHPTTSITHNLFIRERYLFASNYTTGLRILDIGGMVDAYDVGAIITHGYFDTYPEGSGNRWAAARHDDEDDHRAFQGQWSNYPFFASGVVLAGDINGGLFVLRPRDLITSAEHEPLAEDALLKAYPNPFAGRATIALTLPTHQHVRVEVFDALGRRVALLYDGLADASSAATLTFDAGSLPAGVYFVRATGEDVSLTRRLTHVP
jgi:choice-of-anchor B domain-containing protein